MCCYLTNNDFIYNTCSYITCYAYLKSEIRIKSTIKIAKITLVLARGYKTISTTPSIQHISNVLYNNINLRYQYNTASEYSSIV